jgi:hypothetical protein
MPRTAPRDAITFVPRATISLVIAAAVFLLLTGLYALPAMLETPPPGAIADYTAERVRARLDGNVFWLAATSLVVVTALGLAGWLPGMRRRP